MLLFYDTYKAQTKQALIKKKSRQKFENIQHILFDEYLRIHSNEPNKICVKYLQQRSTNNVTFR